jgi:hypothetical protein
LPQNYVFGRIYNAKGHYSLAEEILLSTQIQGWYLCDWVLTVLPSENEKMYNAATDWWNQRSEDETPPDNKVRKSDC